MTTLSKPVIYDAAAIAALTIDADDTNINGGQWARLLRFAGTGASSGYVLTLSAVADTATLSTGWGIWNGYTCEITATHTISLPAVTSAKTYSIGVLFDPANFSTPAGPLTVAVFDKASITIPSGGGFWTLYEIDRLPSTVLTASTLRNMRVVPAATIVVPSSVVFPPAAQYAGGTIAVTPKGTYLRLGTAGSEVWTKVDDDTGEVTSGFTPSGNWTNPGCAYHTLNGLTTVHIRATLQSGSYTATSTGSLTDISVMTVPSGARSGWLETGRGSVTLGSNNTTWGVDWRLSVAGLLTLTSTNPSLVIPAGSTLYVGTTFVR